MTGPNINVEEFERLKDLSMFLSPRGYESDVIVGIRYRGILNLGMRIEGRKTEFDVYSNEDMPFFNEDKERIYANMQRKTLIEVARGIEDKILDNTAYYMIALRNPKFASLVWNGRFHFALINWDNILGCERYLLN